MTGTFCTIAIYWVPLRQFYSYYIAVNLSSNRCLLRSWCSLSSNSFHRIAVNFSRDERSLFVHVLSVPWRRHSAIGRIVASANNMPKVRVLPAANLFFSSRYLCFHFLIKYGTQFAYTYFWHFFVVDKIWDAIWIFPRPQLPFPPKIIVVRKVNGEWGKTFTTWTLV